MADRIGRQTPTESFVLPYQKTDGAEAIACYGKSGREAMDWQKLLVYDILAREEDNQWTHMKYGLSVPRQNGKNEVIAIREVYGLLHGEKILHTAHRTDTSHTARERLLPILRGKLFVGIKYGPGGTNVAVSIAVKTTDGRVFVEAIDCRTIRATNRWIMEFLREASWAKVVIDGQNGQKILADLMRKNHMRKPSLADLVANCEHRAIGSHGGFGYKSIHPEREIALMDYLCTVIIQIYKF